MAHYLVRAYVKPQQLEHLARRLEELAFADLEPFGLELTRNLRNARVLECGVAAWEEEDDCMPPLAQERAAILDRYFRQIEVEPVEAEEGWDRIAELPKLFPALAADTGEY